MHPIDVLQVTQTSISSEHIEAAVAGGATLAAAKQEEQQQALSAETAAAAAKQEQQRHEQQQQQQAISAVAAAVSPAATAAGTSTSRRGVSPAMVASEVLQDGRALTQLSELLEAGQKGDGRHDADLRHLPPPAV